MTEYVCKMPKQACITEAMWEEIVGLWKEQGRMVTANQVKDLFPEQWESFENTNPKICGNKMYKHKMANYREY